MIGFLRRLWLAWMDRHDQAWAPTGIRRLYDGTDESKAVASQVRADQHVEARRKAAVQRSGAQPQTPRLSNVTRMGRGKAAGR